MYMYPNPWRCTQTVVCFKGIPKSMAMHTDGIHGDDMSIVSNDKIIAITGHKTQQCINVAVATQKYADTIHIALLSG